MKKKHLLYNLCNSTSYLTVQDKENQIIDTKMNQNLIYDR